MTAEWVGRHVVAPKSVDCEPLSHEPLHPVYKVALVVAVALSAAIVLALVVGLFYGYVQWVRL